MRRRSSFALAAREWVANAVIAGVFGVLGGCAAADEDPAAGGCLPIEGRFQAAWDAVLGTKCLACHTAQGVAKNTKLVLQTAAQTGWESSNLAVLREVARYQVDGASVLLAKPTARVAHAGGQVVAPGSPEERALVALIDGMANGGCTTGTPAGADATYFDGVDLLDAASTFRRAAIVLAGRVPSADEIATLDAEGEAGLPALIDQLLDEPSFVSRVTEVWNDRLLTNKYDRGQDAVNLLSKDDFPGRKWWEAEGVDETTANLGKAYANSAVAREPLELIAYLVKNDRPFTEAVTADYLLVNPFSARVFGVEDQVVFDDPTSPDEFRPARIPGYPHAGILTSPMLLNRFPTTATNRNRARSRLVWDLFLATDIMRVAERPIDPTGIQDHNPTLFNASCTVCHELIDPIAGTFSAFDASGRYRPPADGWFSDMRPPGFGDVTVPYGDESKGLAWLGERLASDSRFSIAVVRTVYTLLTGQQVLQPPSEEEALTLGSVGAAARARAAAAQTQELTAVAKAFAEDGFRFKAVVRRLVLSPWFRVRDARPGLSAERLRELGDLSAGRLLTPEELDRKITSATGLAWTRGWDGRHLLQDPDNFALFYGGIDSNDVTRRITSPNGLMAAVQSRMANDVACQATARDFLAAPAARLLFPLVETSFEPEDINGFVVPEAEARIRDNLRHLAQRLLGDRLGNGDPDLEALFALFVEVWREGRDAVADDTEDEWLPWECQARNDPITGEELPDGQRLQVDRNYTVRAWMAVLTAMLSDFRFVTE